MTSASGGPRYVTGCDTGKRGYQSKADAKKARRATKRGDGLSTYKCKLCGRWHNGHLAHDVRRGNIARAEMRPKIPDGLCAVGGCVFTPHPAVRPHSWEPRRG